MRASPIGAAEQQPGSADSSAGDVTVIDADAEPGDADSRSDSPQPSRWQSFRSGVRRAIHLGRVRIAFWSRSLLVRVVVLTLSLSTIVMLTLGLILQQQITNGLL